MTRGTPARGDPSRRCPLPHRSFDGREVHQNRLERGSGPGIRDYRVVIEFERDGLIFSDVVRAVGDDPRELRRAHDRGELIRVRRGAYCLREAWDAATRVDRHILSIHAVMRSSKTPLLVAGASAAALWGMPFAARWPADVIVQAPYRGGGKSEPGVRQTSSGFDPDSATIRGGMPVTSLARTALDVARPLEFSRAVSVIDWALWRKNPLAVSRDQIAAALERAHFVRGERGLVTLIEFATDLSDSVGESRARAGIHRLGFEAPTLQVRFVDSQGEMFTDFHWESVNIAGEFDGKVKYTRNEFTKGDPGEVAWREKRREDRLRRQLSGFVRILTEHVERPNLLERLLTEVGVPRERPSQRARDPRAPGALAP